MNAGVKQAREEWLVLRCQHAEPAAFADLVRDMERPLLYFVQQPAHADLASYLREPCIAWQVAAALCSACYYCYPNKSPQLAAVKRPSNIFSRVVTSVI
jgi:hypothetical protein